MKIITIIILFFLNLAAYAASTTPAYISEKDIQDFDSYPKPVQQLINQALSLTKRKLTYTYGSADPRHGGMDCSGTIYYLLNKLNQKEVPRQSDEIYVWALQEGNFHEVNAHTFTSKDFNNLKPGDLLFWSGTYPVKRTIPITHVMLYLGKNRDGKLLMFGSSNGRTYKSRKIWGVSVFDFSLPREGSKSRFIGYGCIPKVTCK